METSNTYTAFEDNKIIAKGILQDVVLKVKKRFDKSPESLMAIYSDTTGKAMDFINMQGSESDVLKRIVVYTMDNSPSETSGPGRPKLGVISREVSLLPRHWEWLATQSSGASATLRKLVDDAIKKSAGANQIKNAQERTYRFMSVQAGNFQDYEEALRALYRKDKETLAYLIKEWPTDVQKHVLELAKPVFT